MATHTLNASAPGLVGWTAGPETRGTLTLVWSCVITIFACTWTVLHLNVPGQTEGALAIILRKMKWMAINILFPEFIFAKAVCDLRLALEELREFDDLVQKNGRLLSEWTVISDETSHKWSWEFEYPLWARRLYILLGLTPPQPPFNEKPLPQWISKILSLPSFEAQSPNESGDIELQNRPPLNSRTPQDTSRYQWRTVQKWTVVHSYYAQMGGILYCRTTSKRARDIPCYCCTASMLTGKYSFGSDECEKDLFKHLILGEGDIRDKSKADWVLKGIAVAQVAWLILSVIVRSIMDLPVTQLEIATISFAVMAILSYAANWWKPKDISQSTILQNPTIPGFTMGSYDMNRAYTQSLKLRLISPTEAEKKAKRIDDKLERVPNDLVWIEGDSPPLFTIMAISSLGFGGLHCIAWYFQFPSQTELLCWRVASVISATLPVMALGISLTLHFLATSYTDFRLVSILLRKLQPLKELPSNNFSYLENITWWSWPQEAKVFLFRTPTKSRDWEHVPSTEKIAQQSSFDLGENSGTDFRRLGPRLMRFIRLWREARELTPYDARVLWGKWYVAGSWMQKYSEGNGILEFWQDYENYIKGSGNVSVPGEPDSTCVAFLLRAFAETLEEGQWWERLRKFCEKASPIVTIASGIIYTISRLVILVLLFTCLREAPAGVYQVTPWLNFLPNFS